MTLSAWNGNVMSDPAGQPWSKIDEALERLDRRTLLESLQPGIDVGTVRHRLDTVGFPTSGEIESLYAWHNGTSTDGVTLDDIHLFPGFYLLSIEDAVANYEAFSDDSRWVKGWLPLFANGGGDFYVVDLSGSASEPVRHFRIDESEHPVDFGSLGAMAETLALGFERDVFFVDDRGYLEMDDQAFRALVDESR